MMNKISANTKLTWPRIAVIAIVLVVAGYQWYVEQNNGPENERPVSASQDTDSSSPSAVLGTQSKHRDDREQEGQPNEFQVDQNSGIAERDRESQSESDSEPYLKSIGGSRLQSPAGLIYGMGGGGEHRVEHVMRHAKNDPNRPVHGVFDGDEDEILKLIDEAYEMIKSKSKYVRSESSQGNAAYTISMGRKIGYEGGQKGKRNSHRSLRNLRLILDGNRVITAYPYR